jgi:hypothetical protein
MSYDSGGTPYAAAVNNGEVLNVEFYETQNGEAPLTNGVAVACNGNGAGASNYSMNLDSSETGNFASPTPWSTANDDLFTYPIQNINGNEVMVAGTNLYASHYTTNRVTRFSDGEIALNDYIVGATNAPAPTGLLFDRTHGVIWVANSNESSLTQINKNLLLYTNETNTGPTCCGYGAWGGSASPGAGAACFATVPAGTNTASIVGYGFDTSLSNGSNNTVLIAGYMAQTTGVALSGVPDGVVGFTVTSGGSGYTTAPNATLSGNCSTEPTAQPTIAGTMNVAVTAGGSGYTSVPVVSFTAGCTQEPAATVTVSGGAVRGVTVSNNGGGCTTGPNVVFTGGGGSGATATATISSGVVDGIRMQAFGSGCVNGAAPSVTLSGSGGAAASSYFVDPVQTTLTINVPRAPHGITGPVIVANQGGQIISYCTYTTQ